MNSFLTAKLFRHGGSQAVRLPKEFRFPGTEVKVSRTPQGVLLEPLNSDFERRKQLFFSLAGSCPEIEDVLPHTTPDLPRDE